MGSKRDVFIRIYLQSLEYEIWCADFSMTGSMDGNSIYDSKVLGLHTTKQYSVLFWRQEVARRCVNCQISQPKEHNCNKNCWIMLFGRMLDEHTILKTDINFNYVSGLF